MCAHIKLHDSGSVFLLNVDFGLNILLLCLCLMCVIGWVLSSSTGAFYVCCVACEARMTQRDHDPGGVIVCAVVSGITLLVSVR